MTAPAALLVVLDLESLAALAWTFLTPSQSEPGVFLWLSPGRLVLTALLLLICLGLAVLTIRLFRGRDEAERLLAKLDAVLIDQRQLAAPLITLSIVPVLVALATCAVLRTPLNYEVYKAWAPDTFPLLHAVVSAILPLVLFFVLAAVELAGFISTRYRRVLFTSGFWSWDRVAPPLLLLIIILAVAIHWLVLAFRLRFFVNLPAWYWVFAPVPFGAKDLWFALIALMLLGLSFWLLIIQGRTVAGLLLVAALGWFLQVGVGLMGGDGLTYLSNRFFSTYHRSYVLQATRSQGSLIENIRRYDKLYTEDIFTSTKPPGLMAFYIGLDHIVNGYPSSYSDALRYQRLTNVVIWLFPVLAVGMVGLLYVFARQLLGDPLGLVPPVAVLLYVLAPSFALFTFFADQSVYPLVFLSGVWLTIFAIRRRSLAWAVLLGGCLYVAAFFAFSMLPLYPFALLYLVLHYWHERPARWLRPLIASALAVAAGTLLLHFVSLALLNYNFLPHFQRAVSINHNFDFYLRVGKQPPGVPEPLAVRLGQIFRAAWFNHLDLAAAIGFPVYVLFVVQAFRRIRNFIRGRLERGDIILLALLASFLVLTFAGTAQGEVPRLWLFWLPMIGLLAAFELEPHVARRPLLLLALGLVQLITLMLTFHFQDLRM